MLAVLVSDAGDKGERDRLALDPINRPVDRVMRRALLRWRLLRGVAVRPASSPEASWAFLCLRHALPAIWSSMAFGNGGNFPKQFSNSVLLITGAQQATSAHGAGAHTPSAHHQAKLPLP